MRCSDNDKNMEILTLKWHFQIKCETLETTCSNIRSNITSWVMGSVALKARRGVAGMCLCVVPTVWMRTPRGVVVNQHPLWASPFFSELCSVQTNTQNMLNLYCPTSRGCIVFVRRWRRHGFAFCVDAQLLFFLSSASCKFFSSSTSESGTHTGPESWLELTEPSANRTCSTHGVFQ